MAYMNSHDSEEQRIIESWHANAAAWARAIRAANIASRKMVTDQAIVDAVSSVSCTRILDLGCGEGWLARALCGLGMSVSGVDVVAELITIAAAMPCASRSGSVAFGILITRGIWSSKRCTRLPPAENCLIETAGVKGAGRGSAAISAVRPPGIFARSIRGTGSCGVAALTFSSAVNRRLPARSHPHRSFGYARRGARRKLSANGA